MSDDSDIPLLLDIVDIPKPSPGTAAPPGTSDMRAALAIDVAFLVDELVDEFLPLIEARLRERLEARQRELAQAAVGDQAVR